MTRGGEMHTMPVEEDPRGILPGGCLPWPPHDRFPPREPEPDGEDLPADVDWMTYSHEQLYGMATQGLDPAGANAVAAKWGDISAQLREIAGDLGRAIRLSEQGWEGSAAELARETAARLGRWSEDTGKRADEAGTCVSRQADIAQRAAREMPEPVEVLELLPGCGTPDVEQWTPAPMPVSPKGDGSTSAMSAGSSPFVSKDFNGAAQLGRQPWGTQAEAKAAHRQAAEVMRTMQQASYEVYGTVPWFAPLKDDDRRRRRPDEDDNERRRPRDDDPADPADPATRSASASGVPSGGTGGSAVGLGTPIGGGTTGALPDGARLGAGGQSGVSSGAGAAAAPAAAASGMPRGGPGMGAMPMGGMGGGGAGGGRNEDQAHKRSSPLDGDKGVFDPDEESIFGSLLGSGPDDDEPPRRR